MEPYYLIHLSLEDLEKLHGLVKELRRIEHAEALKVVRTMLRTEASLFGCVSVDQNLPSSTSMWSPRPRRSRRGRCTSPPGKQNLVAISSHGIAATLCNC